MNFPENLKYTKEHEWVAIEGDLATIGITDFAQGELGDVIYLDIASGQDVALGASCGTVEAVKTVSDIYAPLSGTITEVNSMVNDTPDLVNKDPYGMGWLVKLRISNAAEVSSLLDVADYKALIGQ